MFPGNMYEGDTFKKAIEKIKMRYKVKRVVIVADSDLLSKQNIALLEKENLEFILGARLKSLSDAWQNRILDNTDYEKKAKEGEILRIESLLQIFPLLPCCKGNKNIGWPKRLIL